MTRRNRVIIGAVAAVATFASLASFVGMRHRHQHGMHHSKHCAEQCGDHAQKQDAPPKQTPAPVEPLPDAAK